MTHSSWFQVVYQHIEKQLQLHSERVCVILVCPKALIHADMVAELQHLGWHLRRLPTEPMELRYMYECEYRNTWPQVEKRLLFLIEEEETGPNTAIPFDIERDNLVIRIALSDFFPALDESILQLVPPEKYKDLFQYIHANNVEKRLSQEETLSLVLQACYGIALPRHPTLLDYFRFLSALATTNVHLPQPLAREIYRFFKRNLDTKVTFAFEPSEAKRILYDTWETYRWMVTHHDSASKRLIKEKGEEGNDSLFLVEAAELLNQSTDMQALFTQLCHMHLLPQWETTMPPRPKWLIQGIHYTVRQAHQLEEQIKSISDKIPTNADSWNAWATFALTWARLRTEFYSQKNILETTQKQFRVTHEYIEQAFMAWLHSHYEGLLTKPFLPRPYVVHHLLHFLAATYEIPQTHSLALIVIDGMALDDWLLARSYIDLNSWHCREKVLAAYIPTITSFSRQALLSGKRPIEFPERLETTHGEHKLWTMFWEERGLTPHEIGYWRGVQWDEHHNIQEELMGAPYRLIAVVIESFDKILHRSDDPISLHAQWKATLEHHNYIKKWLDMLGMFFDIIVITSDHGHVEGIGAGDIALGKVAEMRALRARVFSREMENRTIEHPAAIQWPNMGLPPDLTVVIAKNLHLFAKEGQRAIAHGGASLEEVIVPLIILTREE